jgi:hypothetical protein
MGTEILIPEIFERRTFFSKSCLLEVRYILEDVLGKEYETSRHHTPEDSNVNSHDRENLESRMCR